MMISCVTVIWLLLTLWAITGGLVMLIPKYIPDVVIHLYLYGKIRDLEKKKTSGTYLLFPKSYFSHFYGSGVVTIGGLLLLTLYCCCGNNDWPYLVQDIVSFLRYPGDSTSYSDIYSTIIVLTLATIQVARRFQECIYVSVYSKGSITVMVYIAGVGFYSFLPFTALTGTNLTQCPDFLSNIRWNHLFGILVFLWASWNQRIIAYQFAKLRQTKYGTVENTKHHIPHGGYFELVSCPHFFMEIVIYLSMNIVYGFSNVEFFSLFLFVLMNQLPMGYYTHQWYLREFPKYPRDRKAIVPYIF